MVTRASTLTIVQLRHFEWFSISADPCKTTTGKPPLAVFSWADILDIVSDSVLMLFANGISRWKQPMSNIRSLISAMKLWNVLNSEKTVQNRRKLLEIRKVGQKRPSNLWAALTGMVLHLVHSLSVLCMTIIISLYKGIFHSWRWRDGISRFVLP